VYQLRHMTLRYRHTPYFQRVFGALCRDSEFGEMWTATQHAPDDQYSPLKSWHYHHTQHGPIRYTITNAPTVTPFGNLYLAILVPGDAHTGRVVVQLVQNTDVRAERPSPWPNPALCA